MGTFVSQFCCVAFSVLCRPPGAVRQVRRDFPFTVEELQVDLQHERIPLPRRLSNRISANPASSRSPNLPGITARRNGFWALQRHPSCQVMSETSLLCTIRGTTSGGWGRKSSDPLHYGSEQLPGDWHLCHLENDVPGVPHDFGPIPPSRGSVARYGGRRGLDRAIKRNPQGCARLLFIRPLAFLRSAETA